MPVTKDILRRLVKGVSPDSFYEFATELLETKKLKDGNGYDPDSKRRYTNEIDRLKLFQDDLTFGEIDVEWLKRYKSWMLTVYEKKDKTKLSKNSIWNAFKFMRMVFNEAIDSKTVLAESNPFVSFDVGSYEQDLDKIKYLELEDVLKLEEVLNSKPLPDLMLRIGWRFLAMCLSGLRISDAMLLNEGFFNDAGDLAFKTHKNRRHGNIAQVPIISDRQRSYLAKTLSLPLPATDHKSFRTTFNINLKVLAVMAGIQINLTSHVGRHTMGSFLVDAGVEKKAAMAMLGVKSEKVIETYLHLKESKLQSEAQKLKNVF